MRQTEARSAGRRISRKTWRRVGFMTAILFWPMVCFIWNNIVININSFVLAFSEYNIDTKAFTFTAGFENFAKVIEDVRYSYEIRGAVINSFLYYLVGLAMMPVNLIVSFMIYKKIYFSKFFIVVLFFPSIISSIIWVIAYKYIVEFLLPLIFPITDSLIMSSSTAFGALIGFQVWMGLAGGLVIYTGAMGRISPELVEYSKLDGMGPIREFWHLTLPLIYPTINVFLVTGVIGIFNGQPSTLAFHGESAPAETWTLGYYFFKIIIGGSNAFENYPYASAGGLLMTAIAAPVTFLVKWMLSKFDKGVEY